MTCLDNLDHDKIEDPLIGAKEETTKDDREIKRGKFTPEQIISSLTTFHAHDAELAEQRRKADFELAQRCPTDGLKFFGDYSAEMRDPSPHYWWDDPEFNYSAKRNTCLVHISYIRAATTVPARSVTSTTG
jgi:hypothetical protein